MNVDPGAVAFLPSEDEWYKAAYYDSASATYFDYPTGSNAVVGCAAATGTANRANCGSSVGGLTDVGAYPGSASPSGTFDQAGNAWEWNETIVLGGRGLRGGSYISLDTQTGASLRNLDTTTDVSPDRGFRIAMVPEPGTALLLAVGVAGLARARRFLR